jgi:hypothetical protein
MLPSILSLPALSTVEGQAKTDFRGNRVSFAIMMEQSYGADRTDLDRKATFSWRG